MVGYRGLVLVFSAMLAAVLFSGCISGYFTTGGATITQGPCTTGTLTFCKDNGTTCNCPDTRWDPVCGSDGRTYPSSCFAGCNNVQSTTPGECGMQCANFGETCGVVATTGAAQIKVECCDGACINGMCQKPDYYTCPDGTVVSDPSQCPSLSLSPGPTPCLCIANWDPVCGTNGKTYENKCVALCKGIQVAHEGPCQYVCVKEGLPCKTVAGVATSYVSDQLCCEGTLCIQDICQKPHEYTCPDGSVVESPNDCPVIDCGCPTDWDPVCLTLENKTYPNMCIARCGGIDPNRITPGECDPRNACGMEGNECYQSTAGCTIDQTTGEKICTNVTWSTCCEGFICSDGMCKQQIDACSIQGESCASKACCDGYECTGAYATLAANIPAKVCTKPVCKPDAEYCQVGNECCSGTCINSQCAPGSGCMPEGKACQDGKECCSQFCKNGLCAKRANDCFATGSECKLNEHCCSGICDPETYTCADLCAKIGGACSSTMPCCPNAGAYCSDNGLCTRVNTTCNADGARCGTPPATLAALVPSYGECCPGMECINYYCRQPQACDCPQIYDPVCGADGKAYGNPCRARCAGTYPAYEGPCRNETFCSKAMERCGRVYDQQKNVVYDYGKCCEGYRCASNVCVPPTGDCPDCRQRTEACGVVTLPSGLRMDFGNCCDSMQCLNNRCQGVDTCRPAGQQCYQPATYTMMVNPAAYTGNCCDGERCVNGYCQNIPPGCNQTGGACANDNNCCQGRCVNGVCNPGQPPCRKTGEGCTANDRCCATTDSCRQRPGIFVAAVYACLPGATPTPTQCKPRGTVCSPNTDRCCETGDTCKLSSAYATAAIYTCSPAATPSPTPACRPDYCVDGISYSGCYYSTQTNSCQCQHVACVSKACDPNGIACGPAATPTPTPECLGMTDTCIPGVDTCCNQLSCVRNPNVYTHVAYWCYTPATPTPTPLTCSDTDSDTARNPDIYTKGTATGTLVTGGSGSFTDYCLDSGRLYEYDCSSPGQTATVTGTIVTCPRGTSCASGACVQGPA